ncbi:MAG: hypothetical protein RLZZ292_993 [Bacteroidota bacterium]|jgi:outer membrane protein assembly factor BamB
MMLMSLNVFAQRNADWTTPIPDDAKQIFFHSLTGIPVLKGDNFYAGIDVQTHAVKWTIKRSGMTAVSSALGNEENLDYYDISATPFAVVNNIFLDTRDGKIFLDKEKDAYKKITDYEILPSLDAILVKTTGTDGFVKLFLLDKKTGAQKWNANIVKAGTNLGFTSPNAPKVAPQVEVPMGTSRLFQNNQLMSFQYKKQIAMVSMTDGKVLWINELDPARTFFSADEKIAYYRWKKSLERRF